MAHAFQKFDPYAFVESEIRDRDAAKPANPAKVSPNFSNLSGFSGGQGSDPRIGSDQSDPAERRSAAVKTSTSPIPIETGSRVPRSWIDGFAKLSTMPCPDAFLPARWQLLKDDARRFMSEWAERCAGLGWTTEEVFGVDRRAPDVRHDAKGLVLVVGSYQLIGIEAGRATIRSPSSGNMLSIYRRRTAGQIAVWDLPV